MSWHDFRYQATMESPCQEETRRTRAQIQKNALAVRKELLAVPSQQIATLQPNNKTCLDIRYPTVGLHKTK